MHIAERISFVFVLFAFIAVSPAQSPDFEALGKGLVTQLAAREFDKVEARFDTQMKAALPLAKLPEVWDSLLAQTGAFKGIVAVRVFQKQGLNAAFVTCEFDKAMLDAKVFMDSQGQVKGLFFEPAGASEEAASAEAGWKAPPYAKPDSFHERDTTIVSGRWQLPGVLTLPNSKGAIPAVVLVQGSGPHDQDETIGPSKPFKDLAWGLASQNIAVLRYVKRTKQYGADSKGDAPFTVKDEVTDDAIAAVTLLSKLPEINKKQIYLLGHSLGGMLAPRIAAEDPQVAGIIIMAGNARPLEKVVIDQINYIASLTSEKTPENQKQIERAEVIAAQVENPSLKPTDIVDFFGSPIPGSYFLDLRGYDPAKTAAGLKIPVLVLQGGRDYQVTNADFDIWRKELANAPRATFKFFPAYTHLFNPGAGSGLASPHDYSKPGNVSEGVVTDIVRWIKANAAAH
ncbi:MAG TPA: alpha/beta fold hydrolase [Candidatus Binatia bacterium]|nr:alpha/beta fold hydrolase [Candidatus Binatia bacterium]